jgi:hypothetical protein
MIFDELVENSIPLIGRRSNLYLLVLLAVISERN